MSHRTGWREALAPLLDSGESCVLVTVVDVRGSAPREVGATMLVTPNASIDTIGGGALEHEAIAAARAAMASPTRPWRRRYPLGPALGQCCGGQVTLLFDPVAPNERPAWIDDRSATTRRIAVDGEDGEFVLALPAPALELHVFGAGHVGKAVVELAAMQPWSLHWVDTRAEQFPQRVPANVDVQCSTEPLAAVDTATPGAAYLVMTHSHRLDLELVARILAREDARYCGLIGSMTKRRRFERQLAALGLADAAQSKLTCPIGIASIRSRRPAAIAVAVVAELLSENSEKV